MLASEIAGVNVHDDLDERDVVVDAVQHVADDVVSLVLVPADDEPLPSWEPGAHIDVLLAPDLERQYSLCGDPRDASQWRIGVLLERQGRGGSARIHELKPGARLRVRGPRNHFPLVESERYLFIAGGIGITPILPMIEQVAEAGVSWSLVYGGRSATSMAFTDRLAAHGDAVTLWPQDEHGLIDLAGLLGSPEEGTAVYCCGPGPLLDVVEQHCAAGWPEGALHVERFAPRDGALAGMSAPFEVHLQRAGVTVQVGADQSIVDALKAAGIDVATSCRQGTCGTCETVVLGGLPDHRDSILTDAERESNQTMMICCGRSRTPQLVLDI